MGDVYVLIHARAAIVDSNRAQGTPGSTSRPRCDCHDGWMWSSHRSNMSILVAHCLALSHRCVCSKQQQQQPVSSVCALWPFAHKRERIHGGTCVSSLSARALPLSKNSSNFPLSYSVIHILLSLEHAQDGKCLGVMATHFQNGIKAWQLMLSNSLWSDGTPLFFHERSRLAASILWETLDLNESLRGKSTVLPSALHKTGAFLRAV